MPEHSELSMDSPVSARVIREAAEWLVRLHEPDVSAREREAWECWRIQSAEHQRAWRLAEILGSKFEGIPSELGMSVLGRREGAVSRRAALKAMGWLLAIGPAGWLAAELPWPVWRSDVRTATGERRHVTLADGTNITLNTASAIDVAFDGAQRLVQLRAGEVRAEQESKNQQPRGSTTVTLAQARHSAQAIHPCHHSAVSTRLASV